MAWAAGKSLTMGLGKPWEWRELVPKTDVCCMEDSEDVRAGRQEDDGMLATLTKATSACHGYG